MNPTAFWSRVRKTRTCWLWTGASTSNGRGVVEVNGRRVYAYRYAYELVTGRPITKNGLHKCAVKACVRPSRRHVYDGTQRQNMRDAIEAGYRPRNPNDGKSVCKRGHVFTVQNTYRRADGSRECRTCIAAMEARRRPGGARERIRRREAA